MFPMARSDPEVVIGGTQSGTAQTLALAHAHGTRAALLYRNGGA